jgi:hypothetical protein
MTSSAEDESHPEVPHRVASSSERATTEASPPPRANRLSPIRFVVGFGVVSMLADFVYEGGRSVIGPYLATFGASAAVGGAISGAGEAVALVFRLATGPLSDRTGKH